MAFFIVFNPSPLYTFKISRLILGEFLSQKSILIVDDEEDLLEILKDTFELEDYTVYTAENAKDGLELFKNNAIDVIISDENMPLMNGHEFFLNIKKENKANPFLFYFLTGDIGADEAAIKKEGATGLIVKPFDADDLVLRISKEISSKLP